MNLFGWIFLMAGLAMFLHVEPAFSLRWVGLGFSLTGAGIWIESIRQAILKGK
jgi:hypothetical protein